ncbi:mannose-1-phosphate guanylyltransferase [Galbibacter orientalis]|uniref:mannose-1-phosphate guanylyltransferase n=1 Tax=Galbibacter orientalis DSM 19592 TaxID=926559 RepID=I3C7Y5_9FLAO|nr:mannose-1-phosphate guanylyltransferase [Galbibacter orientalis]EIJ39728.1 mannose-1-phosphate guanylyltransferase [Galbibacter orientalis DSM 19592]
MNKNYYAILMAGGIGSRFWPVSTAALPKQFHDILGTGETLIQKTFSRLNKIIPAENIYILTNEEYGDLVMKQLPTVQSEQVILEPAMRNTAPCILYASLKIKKKNPDAMLVVAPSDHWIEQEDSFVNDIKLCFETCENEDVLMTLGIKPTFPNTGYGYIEHKKNASEVVKRVERFCEKPDYKTAKKFIKQGNFLWNAGIFVWNVQSVLNAFEKYQAPMLNQFLTGFDDINTEKEKDFIAKAYPEAENISIDYAIMEPSKNIYVLPASFDWNDLGTWGALYNELPKDDNKNAIVNAKTLLENSKGNIIHTSKNKTVVIGDLKNYIIIDEKDKLLIYPKKKEQEIKNLLKRLNTKFTDS